WLSTTTQAGLPAGCSGKTRQVKPPRVVFIGAAIPPANVVRSGLHAVTFTLKVTKGPGLGAEFPIDAAEARLGRTADNDIVVKDTGASRSHARVFEKGGKFFCEDTKSANGTKVNASVLNGATKELSSGDTITIGEVVFTFMLPERVSTDVNPAILDSETVLKNP